MPDWKSFWLDSERILLAPMEGVVDAVMRELMTRIGGIDLCVTEFIRVTDRCLPESEFRKYAPELFFEDFPSTPAGVTRSGTPVLIQLLGGKPQPLAESAAFAASLGAPGIDLNFGCPAKTVNRHDGGATILKNPERIFHIVSAVRAAIPLNIPVSAKVRLGFSDKEHVLEIAQAAQCGGAAWLTVHARTRDEGYRPPAHWEYIAKMREAVQIPVIANGEIWTPEDYALCRSVSGCHHTMIGRGLMAKPELARVIKGLGEFATLSEQVSWLIDFSLLSLAARNEQYAVCRLKQWLKSLSRHSAQLEILFHEIKRYEKLNEILDQIKVNLKTEDHLTSRSSFPSLSSPASSVYPPIN